VPQAFVKFGSLAIGQLDAPQKAPSRIAGSSSIPLIALERQIICVINNIAIFGEIIQ